MQQNILKNIIDSVRTQPPTKVVFDLDSTLFDVTPRTHKIFFDFISKYEALYPNECEILKSVERLRTDWGIEHPLERLDLLNKETDFFYSLKRFWHERFFSNEYLEYDHPYEGAVEFVKTLFEKGAHIFYLTGRDVARMQEGSERILKKWTFPLENQRAQLILKPERGMKDDLFKKDWLKELLKQPHAQVWFFENEPVNIYPVMKELSEIQLVFFDSSHSGRMQAPHDVPVITDYLFFRN